MELEKFGVEDLSFNDLKEFNGGDFGLGFLVGAIVGGAVYDVYKAWGSYLLENPAPPMSCYR